MRAKSLAFLLCLPLAFSGCSPTDVAGALSVLSVKFSEGSPPVDGQNVTYTGSTLSPDISKFKLVMVFHVKADNTANDHDAKFGSQAFKPILNFRVSSKSSPATTATLEPFAVEAHTSKSLDFPVEIPIATLDKAIVRKIIDGDPIPYFLSGTLKFDLVDGGTSKGSGTSDLDLASGEIATRPSSPVKALLSGLL